MTPELLISTAAVDRGARPGWQLLRQKCPDNPLTFAEISIGGSVVGQIVMEWFVDVVPTVGNDGGHEFMIRGNEEFIYWISHE